MINTMRVILIAAVLAASVWTASAEPAEADPAKTAAPPQGAADRHDGPAREAPQVRAGDSLIAAIEPCRDLPINPPAVAEGPESSAAPAGHCRRHDSWLNHPYHAPRPTPRASRAPPLA